MPISGVAITFTPDESLAAEAHNALKAEERIELGPRNGNRIAATIETESQHEDRQMREWMAALPGVVHIDIAFIEIDDGQPVAGDLVQRTSSPPE